MLEWGAYPSSRGSSRPRGWTRVSTSGFFINWAIIYKVYKYFFFFKAFNSINFPLNITLTASNKFWFDFHLFKMSLISSCIYRFFRDVLFHFWVLGNFPVFLLLLISKFMSVMVREHSLISFLLNLLHLLYLFSPPCCLIRVLVEDMTAPLRTSAWISCLGHSLTHS